MKASVAVALIVCGTALIILPVIINYMGTKLVADAMMELGKEVNLKGFIPKWYDNAVLIIGCIMIAMGAMFSMAPKPKN